MSTLTDALRALQESTDGTSPEAPRTRFQVLAKAAQRARGRRWTVLVAMPIAAALIASTAWGAVTGRLPHWIDLAIRCATPGPVTPAALPAPRAPVVAPPVVAPPLSVPAVSAPPVVVPPVVVPSVSAPLIAVPRAAAAPASEPGPVAEIAPAASAARNVAPTATAPALSTAPSPTSPSGAAAALHSPSTAEQSVYEAAHHAHFRERDPSAALRGWDAYLATYPEGRFAVEARYNRAISLVRLGRRGEAREALAPFATGTYGGYRRAEARGLLDAMASAR